MRTMEQINFYKETSFKDTEIGRIPEDWEVVGLGDIANNMYYGITAKATDKTTNVKMLRTTDIKNYKIDWESIPYCEITEKRKSINKYLIRKGDILVSRAGSVGISVLVDKDVNNIIFGSYLIKVSLEKNKSYHEFIYYYLQSSYFWNHIKNTSTGSTLKNINLPILKSLKIPLPPLEEQKAIAKVLKDFDDLLEIIDKQIEKLERIKKGLMNEYFTKGIFKHEKFKDTEIGRIPEEWKLVSLGEKVDLTMGQSPPSSSYNDKKEGFPFLQGKAEFSSIYPKNIKYTTQPLKIAPKNSILLSVRAPVGDVNIADKNYCIGRGLASLLPKNDIDLLFLFYLLKMFKYRLENKAGGSTFKAISKSDIENLKIPLPSLKEQKAIAERLKVVDDLIETKQKEKEHLERAKKKVMELLLSGKVRIKN